MPCITFIKVVIWEKSVAKVSYIDAGNDIQSFVYMYLSIGMMAASSTTTFCLIMSILTISFTHYLHVYKAAILPGSPTIGMIIQSLIFSL